MADIIDEYSHCMLCERRCGVDRVKGQIGFCSSSHVPHITRAALHQWEEPIISGTNGSGTVFFSGCSLRCVFCQNREISRTEAGHGVSVDELAEIMLKLEREGAHNINFVTPTHHAPAVALSTDIARERGLKIPIVYNTGSYDSISTLGMLKGRVNIYLPDLKYFRNNTAHKLSCAADYPEVARIAIDEMVRQRPHPIITDGIMTEGVIVRILLLPSHLAEAKLSLKYLHEKYGNNIYISLMSQYTPMSGMAPPLDRRTTRAEYNELVNYAERLGVVNAFIQDGSSAGAEYIPDWRI